MDDKITKLEAEYCPPIDPALLWAILSDFDLSIPEDLQSARATLDSLKEAALVEEAAGGFDASGTGGLEGSEEENATPPASGSGPSAESRDTDPSSTVSERMSALELEDNGSETSASPTEIEDLERLDQNAKLQVLQDVFGEHVTRYQIVQVLQRCDGKWNAAMDELLNQVYFGQEGNRSIVKGVDGFFAEGSDAAAAARGRKGKRKKDRRARASSAPKSDDGPVSMGNRWKSAADQIEFIASRTGVKNATIGSIYYEAGASVSKTIAALIQTSREESEHLVTDDMVVSSHLIDLTPDFPTIKMEDLTVLIRLAYPSLSAARELASALITTPHKTGSPIQIIPSYSRPIDVDEVPDWKVVAKASRSATSSPRASLDLDSAAMQRERYDLARVAALSQARAARRKAKSNHLMNGAVAVYSEQGREYAALSARASARAADDLTSAQSTATSVDLHGVDVVNGLRIAQDRVESWWEGLGESRINGRAGAGDRHAGYRIIVGVGRHSEGGKSKLGPAVSSMLRAQGWRIEPPTAGVIVVKGPLRK